MLESNFNKKTFYMIIDRDKKIRYCSKQGAKECKKIIDDLGILDYIKDGKFGEKILKKHFISIQQFFLYHEKVYFVVIDNNTNNYYTFLEDSAFLSYNVKLKY